MFAKKAGQWEMLVPFIGLSLLLLAAGLLTSMPVASAQEPGPGTDKRDGDIGLDAAPVSPAAPGASCVGSGPTVDGVALNECAGVDFTVGGDNKSISVWYTKVVSTATRIVDGTPVTLRHWINTDAQAQQVAAWGQEAWERYYQVFGRHPYNNGCSDNINVRMEDGVGWSGIAYWASPGSCRIGIDSPMVRGGGGQWVVYHEFQHYMQYAFDDGCYADIHANYDSGSAAGNAEYVEGYADLASDAVDATVDSTGYNNAVGAYNPTTSFFDKAYFDVYNKYYVEQVGSSWTSADPHHHMDAVRAHYQECDAQDTIYVLDTLIPSLQPGVTQESLFLNFFAANWAKDWADPSTQPELVYTDDNGNSYGSISLAQNVALSSGSQSWTGQTTADDWAGRYYQVRPQTSCAYVTVDVDGAAGAKLGINLMAADTTAPTSVMRSAWIGEDFIRTFAGAGVHDRMVAAVNAFASMGSFDVAFTCVTPTLDILEPRQANPAQVGDPASPIAFLARFKVTDSGTPVRGLPESSFSAEAEGDAVTIVSGSLQEVGEEYWATMIPPVKPSGTVSVNLKICLDSTICDTETNALIYQDPGNTDHALVFDASGSMDTEDVTGEGRRIDNAKKAGTVLADLLRTGDRVLVMDFSAKDDPPGCGLPGGDGDCELDLKTYLARTDVISPASTTINNVKNAIDSISARAWTPIGAALREAKNNLQAAPYSLNPKHIVLLSDGEENVNPLYADVKSELVSSGVVIDTIGFSGEAPASLLAQIASDTGGTYRFVPTTGGTVATLSQEEMDELQSLGLPAEIASRLLAPLLPGPLGLDDVYDYYETKSQGASRLFHVNHTGVSQDTWHEEEQYVDDSVNTLRLVVAGKQPNEDDWSCGTDHRFVEVLMPGGGSQDWIPLRTLDNPLLPPDWHVRNSTYNDVAIIPNPDPGTWKVRTMYQTGPCLAGESAQRAPVGGPYDFMMNGSVQSDIRLQGRFLPPIVNNQGLAGDNVPIAATLLKRTGTISGALMLVVVEKPGGTDSLQLWDDGAHNDGAANDGIYGATYSPTDVGGTYNVRIVATWEDPANPGESLTREWLGAFWIEGPDPEKNDSDGDGMPDPWEKRCDLDTNRDDTQEDPDRDDLINIEEFYNGTLPCDPDTDDGGERDGSEVNGERNPLDPDDDFVSPLGHITVRPLNGQIVIRWTRPLSYTSMLVYVSTEPDQLGDETDMGDSGIFTLTLSNDVTRYLTFAGANDGAVGDYSDPVVAIPKADPDPPSGAILINDGAMTTTLKSVMLNISAADEPLPGPPTPASGRVAGPLTRDNEVSGDVEMRISNSSSFADAEWESLASEKPWTLGECDAGICRVYAQFRDGADNESFVIYDEIALTAQKIYLPIVLRGD